MRPPSSYSQAVAAEVRAELARKGRSRQWLADAIGMPLSTLNTRCRGTEPFRITELAAVSEALSVDVRDFLPALDAVA